MPVLGLKCKLFRGVKGAQANTEMKNVTDVTLSLESGEADVTTRKAEGWRVFVSTLKEATIEWDMIIDPNDDDYVAVRQAFLTHEPMALFVSDGKGSGLDCDVVFTKLEESQALEEAAKVSVTARPTIIANDDGSEGRAPKYVTGGATE